MKFPQNIEATQPLYTTAMGRWERDMEESQVRSVLEEAGRELAMLNYV
jgi:hypothetical protein